ncbi:rhomboid protein 2 [Dichotomopilus funicola]|uniref:Rhomboid protein 2 n=1 Tax=Dichotomopilus funicola TaxID=1934379 RepID=A0AAN6V898_9PEZI|nr:rhomboid protein 2 [Dichotomopilus funicola]
MNSVTNSLKLSLGRTATHIDRLPLFTRVVLVVMVTLEVLRVLFPRSWWDLEEWGRLEPDVMGIATMYRTNTYPLIHTSAIHLILNLIGLTPLLERFEASHGTLTSLALFVGPLSTGPALIYVVLERFILRMNTPIVGASIWGFLLFGSEAIRHHKVTPYVVIAGKPTIPTWTAPIAVLFVAALLLPGSSFLGHAIGLGVGYVYGLGYLKFLSPPDKILRWIEGKLNLRVRLPHFVSVDQKTYGRFGVLPLTNLAPQPVVAPATVMQLRRDPRLLKLPPYISLLCIVIGVAWLFLLPLDQYSRRTYISENALLPGQVHTYFSGSDQNVFRAYKHEVNELVGKDNTAINDKLEPIIKGLGLKTARQNFTYHAAGQTFAGENLYAILQAPRGDATEAIVLVAAWENVRHEVNRNGVPLALTLLRYFKRWSLWSKDIILLLTPDSIAGPQAWVDAYHDAHDPARVASLPLKSGLLQGAIAIDYAQEGRFESLHVVYDGVNGQLPNLDLINSIVNIAGGQMGIGVALQEMWHHNNGYQDRLSTMLRGMLKQGFGLASGPHSSFIPYHVDAVTLRPFGEGWQDEMALGRVVEGSFRSLNNLLEHLHQSFFFYLLMQRERFVSIGTYLPSAMLVAANFTIMAIALWVKSGQPASKTEKKAEKEVSTPSAPTTVERDLFLPLGVVALIQSLSVLPLYLFNHALETALTLFFIVFTLLPSFLAHFLNNFPSTPTTPQQYDLIRSFSLLLLGMFLSTLATLNFSLALLVGVLAVPLTFVPNSISPNSGLPSRVLATILLNVFNPTAVLVGLGLVYGWFGGGGVDAAAGADVSNGVKWMTGGVWGVLREAAVGWHVCGTYSPVVVWCVWWPAWVAAQVVVLGKKEVKTGSEVPREKKDA